MEIKIKDETENSSGKDLKQSWEHLLMAKTEGFEF